MLSSKQKAKLKGLAMIEDSIFQVGKDGLSHNLIEGLRTALNKRELIKVNVLKATPEVLKSIAFDISSQTKSEVVEVKGRVIVLYKRSNKNLIEI